VLDGSIPLKYLSNIIETFFEKAIVSPFECKYSTRNYFTQMLGTNKSFDHLNGSSNAVFRANALTYILRVPSHGIIFYTLLDGPDEFVHGQLFSGNWFGPGT